MKKLEIWNQRMLFLTDHLLSTGKVTTKREFMESVGMAAANFYAIEKGERGFTVKQMAEACRRYNVTMDWLVGLSPRMSARDAADPLQQIKDSLGALEVELLSLRQSSKQNRKQKAR